MTAEPEGAPLLSPDQPGAGRTVHLIMLLGFAVVLAAFALATGFEIADRFGQGSDLAWREFRSPGGRFSVELPVAPREEITDAQVVEIDVEPQFRVRVAYEDVSHEALSGSAPEAFLQQAAEQALPALEQEQPIRPSLVYISNLRHQGYPGKELVFRTANGIWTVRMILAGNRLYVLWVDVTDNLSHRQELKRFFGSFRIQR
jgi:hypothetical protein